VIDYYFVLGVQRRARVAVIKRAYRRLARRFHPDLNPGDRRAEERFKRISEAYDILSDSEKRKKHDRELEHGPALAAGAADDPIWQAHGRQDSPFDFADLTSVTSGFSSFFAEVFGGHAVEMHAYRTQRRGDDVTRTLSIGFFDSLSGVTSEMILDAETPCPRCGGAGRVPSRARRSCPDCAGMGRVSHVSGLLHFATTCRRCSGEGTLGDEGCGSCQGGGVLRRAESIKFQIPAGVDSGSRVRVPGKGKAGRNGGPPGDLIIVTQVEPHAFFRRIGDNIHCAVPITMPEAALGARIEVPTVSGRSKIKIPPGTASGQKFRLRGKGAPLLRGSGRGDQYVEVQIVTPRATDEKSRQLLKELGALVSGEDLRRGILI
jgi:molecular chaperone DnaJ